MDVKMYENFPTKKYNIIYADPPWTYTDKAGAGNRGVGFKYNLLTHDQIKALPMQQISADDCMLFLWITMPHLNIVMDVIKAYGFTYKTAAFTWIKLNKNKPSLFWGMGSWTRANSELCLLATKGHPKRINAGVHSVVQSPIEQHSKKPSEVKNRIIQLVGDLPRVELFARERTEGWDVWGNEV